IRSQAYPEYCALMLAARSLGKPVKWVGSRFETLVSDHHGRGIQLNGELALDRDGRFLALRVRWVCNMGAYLSQPGPLINSLNPSTHAINAYRIPALYGRHRLALTNTTPTTAYRGAGRPGVSYLVERLVDEAARQTGIDRIELRRRNLIPKAAFPYQTPTSTYDSGDPPGELEEALLQSEWDSFEKRRESSLRRGRLRGIGCAGRRARRDGARGGEKGPRSRGEGARGRQGRSGIFRGEIPCKRHRPGDLVRADRAPLRSGARHAGQHSHRGDIPGRRARRGG